MRGKVHDPETRARCIAEVLAGSSINSVAARFDVPRGTVQRWWIEDGPVEPQNARTREAMAELIYDAVADIFRTTSAQLAVSAEPEWVRQQTAADLAALVNAQYDFALRVLSGLSVGPAEALPGDGSAEALSPGDGG